MDSPQTLFRFGILLSGKGRGSNMQALIDATRDGRIPGEVAAVVSTSPGAPALERAEAAGVRAILLSAAEYPEPGALDHALVETFTSVGAEAICLAGYMRLLGPEFLAAYRDRILNVHPSLLPAFGGTGFYGPRVHQAVLDYGAKVSGVTVQFIEEEYDSGPIILQRAVPVEEDDTAESLAARVLKAEHEAYPEAVRLLAQGRLCIEGRRVRVLPEVYG
jgi:phosphoribosylglycinamide formyltransferase 1